MGTKYHGEGPFQNTSSPTKSRSTSSPYGPTPGRIRPWPTPHLDGILTPMWQIYDEMGRGFLAHAEHSPYNAFYDRPAVLAVAGEVSGLAVLDAGCGPGLYAEELARRGASVTAVDASEEQLRIARERLPATTDVQRAVLGEPLPFDDDTFDLIVCALVIHYVADRAAAFAEFRRVLRPGGRAVVSTQHPTTDWLRKGCSYFDVK